MKRASKTIAFGLRRIQRQRGVQLQWPRRVAFDARVQSVEQTMRFAQCQWCADAQRARVLLSSQSTAASRSVT